MNCHKIKVLNDLKEVDREKFVALVRNNLGVPSFGDSCGFQKIRKMHGGRSDGLACMECDNFKITINKLKGGYWGISKNSVLVHGRYDTEGNWMQCSIGNSASASSVITECIPDRVGRIRASSDHTASTKSLRENRILCAAVESSIGDKRKLTAEMVRGLVSNQGLPRPTADQVKKFLMPKKMKIDEAKSEFALLALAEVLMEHNPTMGYKYEVNPDGTFKYIVFTVPACRKIFECSQRIAYVDCAHTKHNDSYELENKNECFNDLILLAITCKTFNKNSHVLLFGLGEAEDTAFISSAIALAEKQGLKLNDHKIVVMSDRGSALIKAIYVCLPLANHMFCGVHLLRNIKDKWLLNTSTEKYFWAARNAITKRAYLDAMEAIKQIPKKGNALHEYLLMQQSKN